MIKLFRKIRYNLMETGKTTRYFKYAIGEIILVVIGILIALQINNWNDGRNQKQNALDVCERLLEEADTNIEILTTNIERNNNLLSADLALLNMMGANYKEQNARKLDSLMSFTLVTPNLLIKSSVLNQALNDNSMMHVISQELKNNIYDIPLAINAISSMEESVDQYVNDQLVPLMSTQYSIRNMDANFSPSMKHLGPSRFNRDSREVLAMFEFENILDNKYYIFNRLNDNYIALLNSYQSLTDELRINIEFLN